MTDQTYKVIMKCGHSANATNDVGNGKSEPCCVICAPRKEAYEIATTPNLEGRVAKCEYCKNEKPSRLDLPFFEWKPTKDKDSYYCGCCGWD